MTNWMTEKKYAEHMKMSFYTVCGLVAKKKIPAYRIGGNVRIDADEADELIKSTMRQQTLAEKYTVTTPPSA